MLDLFSMMQQITTARVDPKLQNAAVLLCELRNKNPFETVLVRGFALTNWQAAACELALHEAIR